MKLRHEARFRTFVKYARRGHLLHFATAEDGNPVGHRQRFGLVVRDIDEGDAEPVVNSLDLELHLFAELLVSAPRGSSMSTSFGSKISARATATRCC